MKGQLFSRRISIENDAECAECSVCKSASSIHFLHPAGVFLTILWQKKVQKCLKQWLIDAVRTVLLSFLKCILYMCQFYEKIVPNWPKSIVPNEMHSNHIPNELLFALLWSVNIWNVVASARLDNFGQSITTHFISSHMSTPIYVHN